MGGPVVGGVWVEWTASFLSFPLFLTGELFALVDEPKVGDRELPRGQGGLHRGLDFGYLVFGVVGCGWMGGVGGS